jgi:hypothetical protein
MDYKLWIIKIDIIINLYFFIKWTIVIPIDGPIVIPIDGPIVIPIDGPIVIPIYGPIAIPIDVVQSVISAKHQPIF